jgi:hypothetical protein
MLVALQWLQGNSKQDLGRMVMVVRRTRYMVGVIWQDELMGEPSSEKLKRPELLIQLKDGLVLEHDAQGMLWIQQEREE